MLRPSVSRPILGIVLAASVGGGIGFGAVAAWPASGAEARPAPAARTAVTTVDPAPAPEVPAVPAAPAPLTVDAATAIAVGVSPGRVVEVDAENGADDPTEAAEATEATEATDPSEPTDPTEPPDPSGPWFDVTVQHDDGTATEVAVDATTGRVVSTETKQNGD